MGTTQGTVNSFEGTYSITNIPGVLFSSFSFVGMKTQEIALAEGSNLMWSGRKCHGIDEVVVTALGITRDKNLWMILWAR